MTDLSYEARGRRYCDEDIYLSSQLRQSFDVALCHPRDALALMDRFDVVLVRNSGPTIYYPQQYQVFREHALATGARVFNELTGKADMAGKQYLVDLSRSGYPVIPTVESVENLDRLPDCDAYVVKPKFGADSVGLRILDPSQIRGIDDADVLIQPCVEIDYEVSFYFIDRTFEYALYAPDSAQRWRLDAYEPTQADLRFAQRFIDWNGMAHGIQRVDACRTVDGELLLVELEDLNPYLSLDSISDERRRSFVRHLTGALSDLASTDLPTR
ncbi:hypothetical protein NWP10_01400 [Micrococcus sp. HG099]|uniref:hypothetical protein n=1 Tax=Micrococcus sp. HG099 TaxID=2969755 RepID=UPI00215B4A54|nr:hypothetical protein [Micrococcus sp. HG099]MCR8674479.1 hypothetical protein [Micrococcus sp. HG099]